MISMTSQERLLAAMQGRETDHVPFAPFLAYVWENFPVSVQDMGQVEFHRRIGADPLWRGAAFPCRTIEQDVERRTIRSATQQVVQTITPVGSLRAVYALSPQGNTWFLVEHPLKNAGDFQVQTWIEEHTVFEYDPEVFAAHRREVQNQGLSLGMLIHRGKSAFQALVEYHVGTEELIYALADDPGMVESLWRAMVDTNARALEAALPSDYEYYLTWEDSSTQNYSPSMYEKYIASEIGDWRGKLAAAGKHYVQHACGHLRDILPMMKASGIAAVESISPQPTGNIGIASARKLLGSQVGIIGGIEPTHFLHLSEEELGPYAEQVIAQGAGGPFILANSDSCPPGVTMEKFARVAQVARSSRA